MVFVGSSVSIVEILSKFTVLDFYISVDPLLHDSVVPRYNFHDYPVIDHPVPLNADHCSPKIRCFPLPKWMQKILVPLPKE